MKANFLIQLMVLLFIIPSYGQRLKDKRANIKYVSLPTIKLPQDFKTYSVNVYGRSVVTSRSTNEKLENDISMDGFKRLDGTSGNWGHLRISVYTGYVSTGKTELKSKTETSKDKEGKETKKTYYWYEFPFSASGSVRIVDPEGNILASEQIKNANTLSTSRTTNSVALRKKFSKHISNKKADFAKSVCKSAISAANKLLLTKYDFASRIATHKLYWVKKHKLEDEYEKYFELTMKVFKEAKSETPAADLKTKLQDAIDFWTAQAANDPKGDKKLKRLYKAANHNLAVIHFYLDELELSKKYANQIIKSEGKDRLARNLIKTIGSTEKLMDLHGIKTMHFTRDLSDAIAPAKVKAIEEEKEKIAEANNTIRGTLIMNGEKIEGSIAQEKDAKELYFGENGNTKFMVETNEGMKEHKLTADEVTAFTLGERSFVKMNFSPSAKGKTEVKKHIMEELYISDKIKLLQYYPSTGALGDEKMEYAFQKKSDDMPISLMSTQFLIFKKGLAKYFEDCTDLTTMCSEGTIQMNKDDLIKAARIYSELCE